MPNEGFNPGPVPVVQPGDIRKALPVIKPLRGRSTPHGIFGAPHIAGDLGSNPNLPAIMFRTGFLLVALDQEDLATWREPDAIPDPVFTIAATYPVTHKEDGTFDLDMKDFVAALKAAGTKF